MAPYTKERLSPTTEAIHQLLNILRHDFTTDLNSSLAALPVHSPLRLKINAEICIRSPDSQETEGAQGPQIHLVGQFVLFHLINPTGHVKLLICTVGLY